MARRHEDQHFGVLLYGQSGRRAYGRAWFGANRQHQFDHRRNGKRGPSQLRHREVWNARTNEVTRTRTGEKGNYRQLRRSRIHRYRHDVVVAETGPGEDLGPYPGWRFG